MAARKRSPELKAFGTEVTRYREAARMTLTDLAHLVSVSRSYVGQVEAGTTRCREDFARRLDDALNAQGELIKTWNELIRGTKYPKYFVDFTKVEATAVQFAAYEAYLVYGLFQSKDYAHALLGNDEAVQVRIARQARVFAEPAPMFSVVLEESVLYRQIGGIQVMREQCEFLLELMDRKNVKLQVAPTAYYPGVRGSFVIATQSDRSEAAFMMKPTGGETTTEAADLIKMSNAMTTLQAEALNVKDTRAFIRKVIDERWT
ncbi:helix-turn-helix domain-containing protein [Actinomadura kijaniata]|uniref:helix-turn-helix domain-containing protein n=1 Tax=Actinomadura kijaniata TaxID=46161 RepID=UPI0009FBBE5B|nr:helix-turn-helix transcriptional regulator [Actinomadura kijaniata]